MNHPGPILGVMDVHVRDLRYFIAVAEELHFRKAAERLFVSQPVLSRQIARLETMVQARLLERDHRLVRLTPAGEYLLGRARMLLAEWDKTGAELARLGKLHASTLIVGLQTGVGRGLTGRLAAGLREVGWQLEARNIPWSDPLAGVGTKECDAGFAWLGATTDPQCAHVVVAEEPIMLAVSSDHRLATRPGGPGGFARRGWRAAFVLVGRTRPRRHLPGHRFLLVDDRRCRPGECRRRPRVGVVGGGECPTVWPGGVMFPAGGGFAAGPAGVSVAGGG